MTTTRVNGRLSDLRESDSPATAGTDALARAHAILFAIGERRAARVNVDNGCAGDVWGVNMPEGENEETAGNGRE